MNSSLTLAFVAAWFLFGMARMVFTSRMVELRIDNPDPSWAISVSLAATSARINAANYNARGQRLLPWYRAVTTSYWVLVAVACWGIFRRT